MRERERKRKRVHLKNLGIVTSHLTEFKNISMFGNNGN